MILICGMTLAIVAELPCGYFYFCISNHLFRVFQLLWSVLGDESPDPSRDSGLNLIRQCQWQFIEGKQSWLNSYQNKCPCYEADELLFVGLHCSVGNAVGNTIQLLHHPIPYKWGWCGSGVKMSKLDSEIHPKIYIFLCRCPIYTTVLSIILSL